MWLKMGQRSAVSTDPVVFQEGKSVTVVSVRVIKNPMSIGRGMAAALQCGATTDQGTLLVTSMRVYLVRVVWKT